MSNGEDEIVRYFIEQSRLNPDDFPIGIGDDMAEVRLGPNCSVLITTDMLLDGVHFDLKKDTLQEVGYKAIAASLSDCAAMATIPVAAVVAVALPKGFTKDELKQLHAGIIQAGEKYNCRLIGGDITAWKGKEKLAVNIAMLSRRAGNEPVRRSQAKPNDAICVTGSLGGSGRGKHLRFEPRVEQALQITQMVTVNSMMDISDGLSSDLNRICQGSGVGAIIEEAKIPISDDAKKAENPLKAALNDGEDFELLFTLSENNYRRLIESWNQPLQITLIGTINETKKMQLKKADGRIEDLPPAGYDHLK